jgi:hypothetical protein
VGKWIIGDAEGRRLEAFKVLCCRRMMRLNKVEKLTKADVFRRIGVKRSLWKNLIKRRYALFGHLLRHKGMLKTTIEGRNYRGRSRLADIKRIMKDVGCTTYVEIKREAERRAECRAAANQSEE